MIAQIDNQNKAYLLGLYYSDGYVRSHGSDRKRYGSGIKLHIKDKELLLNICKEFPELFYKEEENCCIISTYKKSIYNELISNGMVTAKSKKNKQMLRMPSLPYSLMRHFIRGVFDGDGSITYSPHNGARHADIVMNNYFFMKRLQEYLSYCDIRSKINTRRPQPSVIRGTLIHWNGFVHPLVISSNINILRFSDLIYPNDTILYMERKYNKFLELRATTIVKRFPCPKCNSLKTSKHGKGRIMCNNCKRTTRISSAVYESNLIDYDWMNSRKANVNDYANLERSPQSGNVQRLPASQQ